MIALNMCIWCGKGSLIVMGSLHVTGERWSYFLDVSLVVIGLCLADTVGLLCP